MKTFHISARLALFVTILGVGFSGTLFAEPPDHGPTVRGEESRSITGEYLYYPRFDMERVLGSEFGSCPYLNKKKAVYESWFRDKAKFKKKYLGNYNGRDKYDRLLAKVLLQALTDHVDAMQKLLAEIKALPIDQQLQKLQQLYKNSRDHHEMTEQMLDGIFQEQLNRIKKKPIFDSCPVVPNSSDK